MQIEVSESVEISADDAAVIGYYLAEYGKIGAIKLLRSMLGSRLLVSKELVERIQVMCENRSKLDYSQPAW